MVHNNEAQYFVMKPVFSVKKAHLVFETIVVIAICGNPYNVLFVAIVATYLLG